MVAELYRKNGLTLCALLQSAAFVTRASESTCCLQCHRDYLTPSSGILHSTQKVAGSKLSTETVYSDIFRGFFQPPQANAGLVPQR